MCNACNNKYSGTSIAEQITELTGITTIGSTGYVSQEHSADGESETNNIITQGTFIKTEKVFDLITVNPVTGQTMSTFTFQTEAEAQKYNANSSNYIVSRIQRTNLGNKINPNDY